MARPRDHDPTLDELLARHPGVPLNIEVKQDEPAIEDAVLAVLDRHRARDATLLAAEHAPIMARIRAAAPDMPDRVLTPPRRPSSSSGCATIASRGGLCRPSRCRCRRATKGSRSSPRPPWRPRAGLGLEVHVWTINDAGQMASLLALGVDAIMTDVPAAAMDVLRRRGLR